MPDKHPEKHDPGLLGVLLAPLRAPQRVVTDIETIASALLALQRDARDRLASVDESAAALKDSVGALHVPVQQIDGKVTALHEDLVQVITQRMKTLQAPLDRVDRKVTQLQKLEKVIEERMVALQAPLDRIDLKMTELASLEQSITERMDAIEADLNARMISAEQEIRALRPPITQMASDLANVVQLLPDPSSGPLTRLKDTLTSS